jgi:alkylation response protein AidB-like acyl-CoA dehydrogenase
MLKDTVRRFVQKELLPIEEEVERKKGIQREVRAQIKKKALEAGIYAMRMPAEIGGGGVNLMGMVLVLEELGQVSMPVDFIIAGPPPLLADAKGKQIAIYLAPCMRGERETCYAMTEPHAGSDVMSLRTAAVRKGDHFILNGTKHFITATYADFFIVLARTDKEKGSKGFTNFLVDRELPGVTASRVLDCMGHWGSLPLELVFEDVVLSEDKVLGEFNHGFISAMKWLAWGRLWMGARCVGTTQRVLALSVEQARTRITFGKPLASRQAIQWMIADMATNLFAARSMAYRTAWDGDRGKDINVEAAMFKIFASETLCKAADDALQIYGGMGYMRECPIERIWRDARVMRIWEGTSEILRMLISRAYLKD